MPESAFDRGRREVLDELERKKSARLDKDAVNTKQEHQRIELVQSIDRYATPKILTFCERFLGHKHDKYNEGILHSMFPDKFQAHRAPHSYSVAKSKTLPNGGYGKAVAWGLHVDYIKRFRSDKKLCTKKRWDGKYRSTFELKYRIDFEFHIGVTDGSRWFIAMYGMNSLPDELDIGLKLADGPGSGSYNNLYSVPFEGLDQFDNILMAIEYKCGRRLALDK